MMMSISMSATKSNNNKPSQLNKQTLHIYEYERKYSNIDILKSRKCMMHDDGDDIMNKKEAKKNSYGMGEHNCFLG